MKLVEIETSRGSEAWERMGGPSPGNILQIISTGKTIEVLQCERRDDGGWSLLVVDHEEHGQQ